MVRRPEAWATHGLIPRGTARHRAQASGVHQYQSDENADSQGPHGLQAPQPAPAHQPPPTTMQWQRTARWPGSLWALLSQLPCPAGGGASRWMGGTEDEQTTGADGAATAWAQARLPPPPSATHPPTTVVQRVLPWCLGQGEAAPAPAATRRQQPQRASAPQGAAAGHPTRPPARPPYHPTTHLAIFASRPTWRPSDSLYTSASSRCRQARQTWQAKAGRVWQAGAVSKLGRRAAD